MLQVQFIYDSSNMSESFKDKVDNKYPNQLASYINHKVKSFIIPREGEHLQFKEEWKDEAGNNKSHVNTFKITRVIHNTFDNVLIFSIVKI